MSLKRVPNPILPPRRESRVRGPVCGLVTLAVTAVLAASAAAEVTVHAPGEVLASWTQRNGDALVFSSPEGQRWDLVTDIDDPAIANKGAGSFYPVDSTTVRAAIEAITYPTSAVDVDIFILPYPRRDLLPSSAGDHCIYLSPGVGPMLPEQVHALVAHEFGHVVQHALFPDGSTGAWASYRDLRGIFSTAVYNESAVHKNRPHEIFAEDFRYLFGGALANYSGSIENPDIALPDRVPGLRDFYLALNGTAATLQDFPVRRDLRLYPNPTAAGVQVAFADPLPAAGPLTLSVFDVSGRLVALRRDGSASDLRWDGRGSDGLPAAPGVYYVRVDRGGRSWTGKVLVAR